MTRLVLAGASCALAVATFSTAALAQSSAIDPITSPRGPDTAGLRADLPDNSWREGSQDRLRRRLDPDFALELRFGPYWPQIDDEFGGDNGPYERTFDNDAQFYFGVELDWLPLRIPYVGKIGPGVGWGITPASGYARDPVSGNATSVENTLTIMPMHLSAVLRVDELLRETDVPLAPYGKLGIGMATWSTSTSAGTSEAACDPSDATKSCEGEGITLGVHMALGLALTLDWLEPQRTKNLNELGIGHLYLFGEWMNAALNGLGSRPQLHVGTSTFVGGMAMDF